MEKLIKLRQNNSFNLKFQPTQTSYGLWLLRVSFILYFLLGSSFLMASDPHNNDSAIEDQEGTIYVSSGVTIKGEVFIKNAKIVQLEKNPQTTEVKSKKLVKQKEPMLKSSKKKKEIQKVKEKKNRFTIP